MTPKNLKSALKALLAVSPAILAVFAVTAGRYTVPVREALACILPSAFPDVDVRESARIVILNIRVPRIILSLLCGAGLSVAGAGMQSVFRNPLATPDTLGVASGASFGAALALMTGLGMPGVQLMSFIFGFSALIFSSALASGRRGRPPGSSSLILSGMASAALFTSLLSLVKYAADPQDALPSITYWLMGSFSGAGYQRLAWAACLTVPGLALMCAMRYRLNALTLPDEEARSLGVSVTAARIAVTASATAVTCGCVAVCGQIGWVGLLVPHAARMLFGSDNTRSLIWGAVMGASFLLCADTLARCLTEAEIPVSIITSAAGAPFFAALLRGNTGARA